jgi:hypothetical protein
MLEHILNVSFEGKCKFGHDVVDTVIADDVVTPP